MYKIKQTPEDFIVKELSELNIEQNGQYAYYILKKTGHTTIDALQILSKKFKTPLKNFGFAGNKDRNAVTEQKISIFRGRKDAQTKFGTALGGFENIKSRYIGLEYLGNGKNPISLGELEGNEFTITIRNINYKEAKKIQSSENKIIKIPNFYGPQRFSKNNSLVGRAIIKGNFKKSVELLLENEGYAENKIRQYLEKNKNNYIEALRLIPLKTRKLFVHSYQSFLFNKIADKYLKFIGKKGKLKNIKIPIIGFNFEINGIKGTKLKIIIKKILEEEKINPRDFITSRIPELTSEGGFRDLFFDMKFGILESGEDELNRKRQKIRIKFTLPKSCYATVALEWLFQ